MDKEVDVSTFELAKANWEAEVNRIATKLVRQGESPWLAQARAVSIIRRDHARRDGHEEGLTAEERAIHVQSD